MLCSSDSGRQSATADAFGVAAFGEQVEVVAPPATALPISSSLFDVALGRVDHVEAGVEGVAEQPGDGLRRRPLEADLGPAEAEDADVHVGLAQSALFH